MRCIYQCHKRHYQYTCLIAYAIFLQEVLLSIKHFELSQYTGAFLNYLKYKCIKKKDQHHSSKLLEIIHRGLIMTEVFLTHFLECLCNCVK